jgi:acyl-CoA reductase-like NAD-dependent aldehyde dehydrogenase
MVTITEIRPLSTFCQTVRNTNLDDLVLAERCADFLERNATTIRQVLQKHESYETAEAEIESSVDALRNVHRELMYLRKRRVDSVAVFLPINLPLYSLMLFAAIPSLMSDRVDVRLPAATPEWIREVAEAAHLDEFFPRMHLHQMTRRQFIRTVASPAEAVIFTGRYESAEEVRAQCPDSLFIFQGSGVNPIVVGPTANLTVDAIENIVTARLFNGGQDCAAPDAFLVHSSRVDEFVTAISDRLADLEFGSYENPAVRVGTILNQGPLKELAQRLHLLEDDTVFGGDVDHDTAFVAPTLIVRPIADHDELSEFFAPIFYVLVYDTDAELVEFFSSDEYTENAMYVSLYGQPLVPGLYDTSTVLYGRTVLEVEQGNTAFGGNGTKANYVAFGNHVEVGPALISEALASRDAFVRSSATTLSLS